MKSTTKVPEELYYLEEDFPTRSLRKHQLKAILTTHQIPYLSTITRADLITLYKKHIESKREKLLREYREKQKKKVLVEEEEEEEGKFVKEHRTATHRKKPFNFEDYESDTKLLEEPSNLVKQSTKDKDGFAIPTLPAKRVVKKQPDSPTLPPTSSFNAEDSFASSDDEHELAPRISPKHKMPAKKKEETTSILVQKPARASNITTNKSKSSLPKKKKGPVSFNPEDSFASGDDYEIDQDFSLELPRKLYPKLEKQQLQYEQYKDIEDEEEEDDDDEYKADEEDEDDEDDEDIGEVDKEELVQLYKDQSVAPEVFISKDYYPIKTRAQRLAEAKNRMLALQNGLGKIGIIAVIIYACVAIIGLSITAYGRSKNGYCSNYSDAHTVTDNPVNSSTSLLYLLPPSCIPCPDHGFCVDGELTCDTLYERKKPFYNIANALPIGDDCVHNSVLGRYVGKVERRIKDKLSILQGEASCHHMLSHPEITETNMPIAKVAVKDVLADIRSSVQVHLPIDKIDEIMIIALSAVLEDPKIHYWEVDDQRYLGTDHAKYTLGCQIKRLYMKTPFTVKMYILKAHTHTYIVFICASSAIYGVVKSYRKNRLYKQKIINLVKSITSSLKEQYDKHLKDSVAHPSPAVPVSQLRAKIVDVDDHKTISLWKHVVFQIEHHPHIRKSFREVRGDPVEYWELTA